MTSRYAAAAAAIALVGSPVAAFDDHVFVVTSDWQAATGSCAAVQIDDPWTPAAGLEVTGPGTTVRHFFGLHYVVHPVSGDVQVIDPDTFETVRTFSVGASSMPHDIVVVASDKAYVSRHAEALLYEVDPRTGDLVDTVDLAVLADRDGIPEMSMMALDGNHLFVQLQRVDQSGQPVLPAYLGVVDVRTNELVDADPDRAGVQGIALTGVMPGYKMQIDGRRLYVSEPGFHFDSAGGIDEIDLDSLTALGFITTEQQLPLQITGFVLTSPVKGYAITHTDIALSSHLAPFSRIDGSRLGSDLTTTLNGVDSIAHDPLTDQLFFPDPSVNGLHVFDATTQERLNRAPVETGSAPVDLVVARAGTPGEATDLRAHAVDPATEQLSISYTPACNAANHTIVFGPLANVASHGYSGQVCDVGVDGSVGGFEPGKGSYFFLVVGHDGSGTEGSYGVASQLGERPEDLDDPACALVRDLSLRCDRREERAGE